MLFSAVLWKTGKQCEKKDKNKNHKERQREREKSKRAEQSREKNKERGDESNSKNERETRRRRRGRRRQACRWQRTVALRVRVCVCSRQTAKLTSSSQSFWRVTSSNCAAWLCVCDCVCRRGRGSKAAGKLHYYASVCSLHCSSNNNNNKLQQNTQKQKQMLSPPSPAAAEAIRKLQPAANSCEAVGRGRGTGRGSDSGCRRRVGGERRDSTGVEGGTHYMQFCSKINRIS